MQLPLIVRAIITGFGYKLGAELARYVGNRVGLIPSDKAKAEEPTEDIPDGVGEVPADPEDEPDDPETAS